MLQRRAVVAVVGAGRFEWYVEQAMTRAERRAAAAAGALMRALVRQRKYFCKKRADGTVSPVKASGQRRLVWRLSQLPARRDTMMSKTTVIGHHLSWATTAARRRRHGLDTVGGALSTQLLWPDPG